ncbi:MAG TPA: imidazoleglycerol-phosphate dehydratase, partial [Clostridiales bacterium]|nr:imidazoleglycerol-phosphate dehydratase [Clostridiales bacterium]
RVLYGRNTHHMIEAAFKALGQALRQAVGVNSQWDGVPSTKGLLD